MNLKTLLAVALVVVAPMAVNAATVFDVDPNSPNPNNLQSEDNIADGDKYGDAVTIDDSVSVDVRSQEGDSDTFGVLGFDFSPEPILSIVEIVLSGNDFGLFGDVTVGLAASNDGSGVIDSQTVTSAGQIIKFGAEIPNSPLYVFWDWENDVTGSFNTDVKFSAVPAPAGILLMGTVLAGFGVMRRRKKAA